MAAQSRRPVYNLHAMTKRNGNLGLVPHHSLSNSISHRFFLSPTWSWRSPSRQQSGPSLHSGIWAQRESPENSAGHTSRHNRKLQIRRCLARCWCERGDSNPHGFPRQILSLVRLPIPPLSHIQNQLFKTYRFASARLIVAKLSPFSNGTPAVGLRQRGPFAESLASQVTPWLCSTFLAGYMVRGRSPTSRQ